MKLPPGKVPINVLEEVVFRNLGVKREEVVLGPATGFDGSVIDVGDKSLIVSMDPITGAMKRIGWLAVNINANDVATFGVEPIFFSSCILLPRSADRKTVETICTQMNKAARDLGIAIVGGHCEVTPGLSNSIIIGCAMGVTEKGNYVTAGGAKPGDKIIFTKSAGIEGTAILASDEEERLKKVFNSSLLEKAEEYFNQISIVKEAIIAFRKGGVNAMHDPTEGGLVGGIREMTQASALGVKIYEERIKVQPETAEICNFFAINPLQLMSSGALLISAKPEFAEKIVNGLEKEGIPASIIGEFLQNSKCRIIIGKDGKTQALPKSLSDHIWLALKNRKTDVAKRT